MSVFAPLDVRGPDQRRKKLIQRLMGQAGGRSVVPMPMRSGALTAEGHAALQGRAGLGRPSVTHGSNILPSILARLGVSGRGLAEEVSPGRGLAIAPPVGRGINLPTPSGGTPIPTPSGPVMPPVGPPVDLPDHPAGVGQFGGSQPTSPAGIGAVGGPQPTSPAGIGAVGSAGPTTPAGVGALDGLVPLGNGMYYDPHTDTVVGGGDSAGSAARGLGSALRGGKVSY